MCNLDELCAHLQTCRLKAALCGSAATAKLSQHPHCAKVVTKQQLSSHRFTAKAPGTLKDFQIDSI